MSDDDFFEELAVQLGVGAAKEVAVLAAELALIAQMQVGSEPGEESSRLVDAYTAKFEELAAKPYMTPALVAFAASRAAATMIKAISDRIGIDAVSIAEVTATNARGNM